MTYHGPRCTGGPWDPVPLQPEIDALHTQLAKAADTTPAGELSGPGDGGGRERLVKCLGDPHPHLGGAAVQGHPVAAAGKPIEAGQIPLPVADLGQDRHLPVETLAGQLVSGLLDTPAAADCYVPIAWSSADLN